MAEITVPVSVTITVIVRVRVTFVIISLFINDDDVSWAVFGALHFLH